ncbi:hypothetical protein K432DRAFT_412001, partial [Lepidopterella palustris CBS 459.81]
SAQLELLTSGSLTFRLEPYPAPAAARQLAPPLSLSLSLAGSSRYTSARASAAASTAPPPRPDADAELEPELEPEQQQLPLYRMSRAVKTVDRLWREWTVGLRGGPSIRSLDARWGSRWRAGRRSEIQWYSLRLEAIKEIGRIAQAGRTGEEAAMWQLNLL